MLYPEKVARALQASLPLFQQWDRRHAQEVDAYSQALDRLGEMTTQEIEERLANADSSVGARPSEEHGSPIVLPFGQSWSCHEEARRWAFNRIQDVKTLAVDGSQIPPNKDYSYSVAAIQIAWFQNCHCADGRGFVKDARFELLPPDNMLGGGADDGQPNQEVNLQRFRAEVAEVVYQIRGWESDRKGTVGAVPAAGNSQTDSGVHPPKPGGKDELDYRWGTREKTPVAFFDGTMVVSFATSGGAKLAPPYVEAIMDLLKASRECGVPVVGFVDTSYAKDLSTMLPHLMPLDRSDRVNDAHLLWPRMKWGDRSRAFVCAREGTMRHYVRGDEDYTQDIAFFYLQTTSDGPPARVDIPRWVVQDGLVDHVADVIRCEVIAGTGYPYCFQAVDAAAVLNFQDRDAFYAQLQTFCEHNGMRLRLAPKAASKRRRRA